MNDELINEYALHVLSLAEEGNLTYNRMSAMLGRFLEEAHG